MNLLSLLTLGLCGRGIKHDLTILVTVHSSYDGEEVEASMMLRKLVWLPSQARKGERIGDIIGTTNSSKSHRIQEVVHRPGCPPQIILEGPKRIQVDLTHLTKSGWLEGTAREARFWAIEREFPGWQTETLYWLSTKITAETAIK